jgi:hypothetical protein
MNFTFTATNRDDLTVKLDFAATGATFVACEQEDDAYDAIATLYDVAPASDIAADDGILTIFVPKADADVVDNLARYAFQCRFTAAAYAKGQSATVAQIHVLLANDVLKTADLAVPAPQRLPVAGTKLSVDIVRDTLFSSTELTALLNTLVKVMQARDATFDISRLLQVSQKLNLVNPAPLHITAADKSTVTLSTSFTGVSVTDTAALATDTKSSVEALGYEADVDVEDADIEVNCTEGCGTEECGLCLDGNACTDASQCFSGQCEDGTCGGNNSAASLSVLLCAAAAALASIALY